MAEDFQLVERIDFLLDACRDKSVLHLGCTNYPYTEEAIEGGDFLHFELEKVAKQVTGLDSDAASLEMLTTRGSENLVTGDLENLSASDLDETFDVVLAGEVIEHLSNPGLFLNGVKRFMDSSTRLIVTTVNAYAGVRFFRYGLRGKRGRVEPVHPDHVAYYSYATLKLLIERHDLRVEQFLFYDVGREHRPHNRWVINLINDISVRIAPQWADGVIAVCRLDENGS